MFSNTAMLCPQLKKLSEKNQEPVTEEEMANVAKKVHDVHNVHNVHNVKNLYVTSRASCDAEK